MEKEKQKRPWNDHGISAETGGLFYFLRQHFNPGKGLKRWDGANHQDDCEDGDKKEWQQL